MSERRPWTSEVFLLSCSKIKLLYNLLLVMALKNGQLLLKKCKNVIIKKQELLNKLDKGLQYIYIRWHNHLDPSVSKREWTDEE